MVLAGVLDLLTMGVILVDATGRIVRENAQGRAILAAGQPLRCHGDHLTAVDTRSAACLRDAIGRAAIGAADVPSSGFPVVITSGNGADLAAWVMPLKPRAVEGVSGAGEHGCLGQVAVFVRELVATCDAVPVEHFAKRFGLTPAECRVLLMLTKGMTPVETAHCLGTAHATTKTHIARLFQKTGARRQADLIRLVMSALAPVRIPGA